MNMAAATALEMAAAAAIKNPLLSCSQTKNPPRFSIPTPIRTLSLPSSSSKTRGIACYSSPPDQQADDNGADVPNDSFPSPDDSNYLLKLVAGSVGGGAVIKYGSILFPDITRPSISQALLMVSLPVVVAVLILIKESRTESQT